MKVGVSRTCSKNNMKIRTSTFANEQEVTKSQNMMQVGYELVRSVNLAHSFSIQFREEQRNTLGIE
ncbi:hypothetical protein TSUD_355270 [Trifolium subterraneum]|uniref:Uncharacterized protein n=1 Tax=Trifolium subterraneum TaxID=3900 RepID=A0A2Z6MG67_TRISU|nr:hypothetical protein TSUD_355210 [Trifolium subterraneum]GAU30801.1 hypothetical protein TSUD_355270 [Trifolium subterraneum]